MNKAEQFIQAKLKDRQDKGLLRQLPVTSFPHDFCSNDYLGFARSEKLHTRIEQTLAELNYRNGSGGSRLLSGNHPFTEETEQWIADFHHAGSGLIFNSGYDANVGIISSLVQRGDTIISDELIHASLIDGARLTYANRYSFKHNNPDALEAKLKLAKGNCYVVVESVYSMDGDLAPLKEISELCDRYHANLIVDEAHALGVLGPYGKGMVQDLNLESAVFARIVTFGKALGCHGAIVLGSKDLRSYLLNFARSFIYTTAAPIHTIASIRSAYQLLSESDHSLQIQERINYFTQTLIQSGIHGIASRSPIQTLIYNNETTAKAAATALQQQGFDVRAILSPTVPKGKERLRICLHTFNTNEEIQLLIHQLNLLHE